MGRLSAFVRGAARGGDPISRLQAVLLAVAAAMIGSGEARADAACPGVRLDVLTPGLASTPYVVLETGGRRGPWLIDFGATRTTVSPDVSTPDKPVRLSGLGLPGLVDGPRSISLAEGGPPRVGVGTPQGAIGTDVLTQVRTEFHFENANAPYVIMSSAACEPSPREGFLRADQTGFFGRDAAGVASGRPNVPALVIELAERSTDKLSPPVSGTRRGARVRAQIDTGYADSLWPYSVDVNEPYLAELKRFVPALTLVGLVGVAGCGGEDTRREVYVAPGWRLEIVMDGPGPPTIPFNAVHFIVKPKATACGGIGPMEEPAAQLGASFLRAFGTTIFDPRTAEVWIKPP